MNAWNRFPFVRFLIPLVTGIVFAFLFIDTIRIPLRIGVIAFAIYLTLELIFRKKLPWRFRWVYGVLISVILIVCGFQLTLINTAYLDPNNIVHIHDPEAVVIKVIDPVAERPNSYKVTGKVVSVDGSIGWQKASGKVLLYFEKSPEVSKIRYGDVLVLKSNIEPVDPPRNPGEFDYRSYLKNKGIYNRGFVQNGTWKILGHGFGNPVKATGIRLRNVFLHILEVNNISGKEYAVVSAILLGYDEQLDPEQKRQFAGAGAMHILCVSGLHVGIIYVILNWLLVFLDRKQWTRLLKVFLLLLLIWFYAAVTGFSPSVLRASTMFSFITIGRTMNRKADIFNMLAASAFLLLVINPYMLTEVGFQLSYLAVTGIVLLYKPIYNLFIPGNFLLNKIWQITVVSLAATLFTFPLTLFYFNQFPALFLLTNLVAIPASMLIIYLGIGVLAFSFIPSISSLIAWLLVWIIKILNFSVQWIEGLSFATLRGIYLDNIQFVLLAVIILSLTTIILSIKKQALLILSGSLILLMMAISFRKFENLRQKKIVIYDVYRATGVDFITGNESCFLADSSLINDPSKIEYNIAGFRTKSGISNLKILSASDTLATASGLLKRGDVIIFGDLRLVIIRPGCSYFPGKTKLKVDYLLVSGNPNVRLSNLVKVFNFDQIIFDASNAPYRLEKWKQECSDLQLNYYDVAEKGAWVIDI